jgi:hypothetical protein
VLARGEGEGGLLRVEDVGRADVDDVDVRVSQHGVVVAVPLGAVAGGEARGAAAGAGADMDETAVGDEGEVGGEEVGDGTGGENAPADRPVGGSGLRHSGPA